MIANKRKFRCIVCGDKNATNSVPSGRMCDPCYRAFNLGIKYAKSQEYTQDVIRQVDQLEERVKELNTRARSVEHQMDCISRRGRL